MTGYLMGVRDALRAMGYDAHTKRLDAFTGREGIVLRPLAYSVTERDYAGGEAGDFAYRVIVRRRSAAQAEEDCRELAALLPTVEAGAAARVAGCRVQVEPQELELDEAGFHAWEARIAAHIVRR